MHISFKLEDRNVVLRALAGEPISAQERGGQLVL